MYHVSVHGPQFGAFKKVAAEVRTRSIMRAAKKIQRTKICCALRSLMSASRPFGTSRLVRSACV